MTMMPLAMPCLLLGGRMELLEWTKAVSTKMSSQEKSAELDLQHGI
jgi:hypothetical protein